MVFYSYYNSGDHSVHQIKLQGCIQKHLFRGYWYYGCLVFLCESEKEGTVYKARLHNPVQDIQKLAECVKGDRIRCKNGLIYCYGISSALVYPILKKYSPKFVIGSIQSKKTPTEKLKMVNLFVDGTVTSGKDSLLKYQKNIMKKYQ